MLTWDNTAVEEAVTEARDAGATRLAIFGRVKATLDRLDEVELGALPRRRRYRIDTQPRPANWTEALFADGMRERGWMLSKRGWPDFICVRESDGYVILVEVKPRSDRKLRREQVLVLTALASYGVPIARWSPGSRGRQGGFETITAEP